MARENTSSPSAPDTTHLFPPSRVKIADIKSRPHQPYETGGALSSRMIIESASYVTTPCSSPPPNDFLNVFSAQDAHHKVMSVGALAKADQFLEESKEQDLRNYTSNFLAQGEDAAVRRRLDDGNRVGEVEGNTKRHGLFKAEEHLPENTRSKLYHGVSAGLVSANGLPPRALSRENEDMKRIAIEDWLNAEKPQDH